ncbi:unnamed protein product [Scytosiphon promiscuus]
MDPDGGNPAVIFFTGGVVSPGGRAVGSTTGIEYGNRLLQECHDKAKAKQLTVEDEKKCGRPLGVKIRAGKLYILDAYHGLFELDLAEGGRGKHLIDSSTAKPLPLGWSSESGTVVAAAEATLPLTFLNDLAFTNDGTIFLSDSSWKFFRAENRKELVNGEPNGRLLRFDPSTGDLRTVMCGLHFPNGVELDQSGLNLLVVESMRFRILEINLDRLRHHDRRGLEFCGEREALPDGVRVFAEALPGFVDNLVFDEQKRGYVAAAGAKAAAPFSALHFFLQKPAILRNILGKLVPIRVLEKSVPRYGLVFVLGLDGSMIQSFHDPTGRTALISSAHRSSRSGYTFLGSSQNGFLGRVRL